MQANKTDQAAADQSPDRRTILSLSRCNNPKLFRKPEAMYHHAEKEGSIRTAAAGPFAILAFPYSGHNASTTMLTEDPSYKRTRLKLLPLALSELFHICHRSNDPLSVTRTSDYQALETCRGSLRDS